VPPGEYTLQTSRSGTEAEGVPEVALMRVFVDGSDIENVMLAGSNGGVVSGKVISEEGVLPKTSGIRINISEPYRNQPPPVLLGAFRQDGSRPTVLEDGSFRVAHVFGRARFQITVPDGWMVKHVRHEGRDITDDPIELRSGQQLTGVEIMLTNRVTQIDGQVVDEKSVPVGDATVLLFPADANRWYEKSQAIRATRPDQQGRWQLKAMPSGDYLAVALDYMEVDAWQDPEYLESLRRYAERVTISEGGAHSLALKVVIPK
jgi:hypothetical protein